MDKQSAEQLLRQALNNPAATFREGQWEAIDALVNGRKKLLVVQRTGWGKSSVYFISTRILRDRGFGASIIVSPLLALMRNQIEAAERLGIRAIALNSTNQNDWAALIQQILSNQVDCILVSPEHLAKEEFSDNVLQHIANRIGLVVVDEAHCISDWGHDFRPDYRRLLNILRQMPPNMPILGTTATANNRVITDVVEQLGDIEVQRGTLVRESLSLQNIVLSDQSSRLAWLAENIPKLSGAGIVYVLTKRDADQVTAWLKQQHIDAAAYYGDVKHSDFEDSNTYRQYLEACLLNNQIKVLVATSALGMGYDKPDLKFVIHYQSPGSIVAYYQQVGRAGRGIPQSYGFLLSGQEDEKIHHYFRQKAFPSERQVNDILVALGHSNGLSVRDLEESLNLRQSQLNQVLKYLSVENPAPVIKDGSQWRRTPVAFRMNQERIVHLTRQREQEWNEVQAYIQTQGCLMEVLRHALDDSASASCGKCANCLGKAILPITVNQQLIITATRFLKQSEFIFQPKIQVAADAFPTYGFRGNLPEVLRASEGRILSRWGDAGWGEVVEKGKHAGRFSDELVEAVVEMFLTRWQPNPAPQWLTCVPSLKHPTLVADFSKRLAQRLDIPFIAAISKIRDNQQQKLQQNRYHQCRNLDGAFAVAHEIPTGSVLLVDDVIDSGWTVTVLAALLLRHGCSNVYPLALASTSTGD
jgi:ATP-dependent DNA helicase RecQ